MNIDQIKSKIDSREYDFLRSNEHLGPNIILLTLGDHMRMELPQRIAT